MNSYAKAIEIAPNIYWVGARDWAIRDFHGYETNRGSTYNAFLIIDEKVTLIDTVKKGFFPELRERIASVIDPEKIDYIVSNHAEPDHTGTLCEAIQTFKPEKVFASVMGQKALIEHYGALDITPVKSGDTLALGKKTLSFIETRMLHWPDSMFSYLVEDQILFSQDAFGMHLATEYLYSDEVDKAVIRTEAEKYFANILLPYAGNVLKLLDQVAQMNLPLKLIAPDHGPLHRNAWMEHILKWYREFAEQKPKAKAVVFYATMWGSTDAMARAIGEGLRAAGLTVQLLPLSGSHRSNVMTAILDAGVIVAGSPTLNNQMYPSVADTLIYLKGLKPKNKIGGVFGSYGWSGEAPKQMLEVFGQTGIKTEDEGIRLKYVPDCEALTRCFEYGLALGKRAMAEISPNA